MTDREMILSAWLTVNALDAMTSYLAIQSGAEESNPLMRLIGVTTILTLVGWKLGLATAVMLILFRFSRLYLLRTATAVLGAACVWNLLVTFAW